jgi:two-component system sensor histidine kinase TctE
VVIQIAETTGSRRDFTRQLVLQSVVRNLLLLALGAAGGWAIAWALRPLAAAARRGGGALARQDLRPVRSTAIPADVRPLVEAINQHIERHREISTARRAFIDDASHQLRTPLTTLATQLAYALRETRPDAAARAPAGPAQLQLDETVRQTNQMLALARADSAESVHAEPVDAAALAEASRGQPGRWHAKQGLDLGFEAPDWPAWVHWAQSTLLARRCPTWCTTPSDTRRAAVRSRCVCGGWAAKCGWRCWTTARASRQRTGACRRALLPRQP